MSVTIALCVFAGAAALAGWFVAARGRRWDLVAYLVGVPAAALAIALVGSPWVDGKAFAIVSPVLLFAAFLACVWAWSERRFILGAGVAALLGFGVVWSNAFAYNEANLAPRDQLAELEEIGEMLDGEGPVLMTEYQPYGVRHFLREAEAEGASELRRRTVPLADGSTLAKGMWADTDDFRADAFEPYEALVLRRSPEQSRPPGDFKLKRTGEYYEVWVRDSGVTTAAERLPLGQGRSPVAEPDCADVRALAKGFPGGTLLAASSEEPVFLDGTSGEVDVEGGTYTVWLEGSVGARPRLTSTGRRSRRSATSSTTRASTRSSERQICRPASTRSRWNSGSDLAPGSGGAREHGALAIGRETEAKLTTVELPTTGSYAAGPGTGSRPAPEGQSSVARQTQMIAASWSGRRPQSAQRGTRSRSSPLICSGFTAMWTFAGNTATRRTISHQRASFRVAGGITARPPASSAQPEWKTAASGLIGT